MYLTERMTATMVAFMEALLPDNEAANFAAIRAGMPKVARELFDPCRFDSEGLKMAMPAVFTALYWLPVVCFWLAWKPLPLPRLSVADRQRVFFKLEHSRLYLFRGLYVTAKMFCSMVFFHDERTWAYVGFDGKGELPLVIQRTALDDLREGKGQSHAA